MLEFAFFPRCPKTDASTAEQRLKIYRIFQSYARSARFFWAMIIHDPRLTIFLQTTFQS